MENKVEIIKKIKSVLKDNEEDRKRAVNEDDFEEEAYCRGYETALEYVLGLLNE